VLAENRQGTVVTYTADFTFTGAAKLASPILDVGLQKIGHHAASQMAECLDRLGVPASRPRVDEHATGEREARENRATESPA
jgi:hypothetical protein